MCHYCAFSGKKKSKTIPCMEQYICRYIKCDCQRVIISSEEQMRVLSVSEGNNANWAWGRHFKTMLKKSLTDYLSGRIHFVWEYRSGKRQKYCLGILPPPSPSTYYPVPKWKKKHLPKIIIIFHFISDTLWNSPPPVRDHLRNMILSL